MARRAASAAVAIIVGAVGLLGGCGDVSEVSEGDCGVEHRYDGARYLGPPIGAVRQPRGGRPLGQAERVACRRVIGHDAVFSVPEVSPEVAVVVDGYLLVRRGTTVPNWLLRAASRPVHCSGPATFRATWQSSVRTTGPEGPETNEDGSSGRPYRLEVDATGGDHAVFARWQRIRLTILVTEATELAPQDEHDASHRLLPMLIATHCDGDRFVADRIDLVRHTAEPSRHA